MLGAKPDLMEANQMLFVFGHFHTKARVCEQLCARCCGECAKHLAGDGWANALCCVRVQKDLRSQDAKTKRVFRLGRPNCEER